jgi:hypothetical protein
MARTNRMVEAMKENVHLLGLGTVLAVSAATLSPIPLLGGLVLEAAYLLTVPDSRWYQARLARRFDEEVRQRRQKLKDQTLPGLRPQLQTRFFRLEEMRKQIDQQSQNDKEWFREVVRKLDYLLDKFLLFAAREAQFRDYLVSLRDEVRGVGHPAERTQSGRTGSGRRPQAPLRIDDGSAPSSQAGSDDEWTRSTVAEIQRRYDDERQAIEEELKAGTDEDTRAVLQKRMDVLQRRHEFAGKIGKILANINHQLQLVEDTFGLINDEIRARSPEQILADIEEVVVATDSMSATLEELAPYEQMAARIMG